MRLISFIAYRALFVVLSLAVASCGSDPRPSNSGPQEPQAVEDADFHGLLGVDLENATRTESGLYYQVLEAGSGDTVQAGSQVEVHYTGWLADGGKFDSSRDRGRPATFAVGVGGLIQGWDEAIPGMTVGERRLLMVPSDLGYGASGRPPGIPPHAVLVFDVQVLSIVGR